MFNALILQYRKHQALALLLIACVVGVILGAASAYASSLMVLLGLIGLGLLVWSIFKPEIGIVLILISTTTIIFEEKLPLIPIGIGSLNIPDVYFLGLLGWIIFRALFDPNFKITHTPIDLPLLGFLGLIIVSTFLAMIKKDISYSTGIRGIREVSYFGTFFIVTNLIRQKGHLKALFKGLIFLTVVVAIAMIAQFILGTKVSLFPGRIEALSTEGLTYSDITRVLPPGQSLIMVLFIALVVMLIVNKKERLPLLLLGEVALIGIAVVITFNRNFWVSIVAALGIFLVMIGWKARATFLRWVVLFVVIIGILMLPFAVFAPNSKVVELVTVALQRFNTLSSTNVTSEDSLQFRFIEMQYAIPVIKTHPILGIGLGNNYRPFVYQLDYSTNDWRYLIHNSHFWLLMMSGWDGYFLFMFFSISTIARGLKTWQLIPDPYEKSILLGFSLAYIGVLIGALVNPIFQQWFWTGLLGVLWGIDEVIMLNYKEETLSLKESPHAQQPEL